MKKNGAPFGNTNNKKLKTPELRKEVYLLYCEHLSKGNDPRGFHYDKDGIQCVYKTVENYMSAYPDELPPILKEVAWAKGYNFWEQKVIDSALGKNRGANTASLQMLMRNKFGWDAWNKDKQEVDASKLTALADFFAKAFGSMQAATLTKSDANKNHNELSAAPSHDPASSQTKISTLRAS